MSYKLSYQIYKWEILKPGELKTVYWQIWEMDIQTLQFVDHTFETERSIWVHMHRLELEALSGDA